MGKLRDQLLSEGSEWKTYVEKSVKQKVSTEALSRKPKRIKGDAENKGKLELAIEKEIVGFLCSLGWPVWKMKIKGEPHMIGGGRAIMKKSANAGFPDLLCCANSPLYPHGLFLGIEVKRPGGSQSGDQQNQEDYIKTGLGIYIIATSIAEVKLALYALKLYPFKI